MPRISALGGMSSRGFGEFAKTGEAVYVEDVFSTYIYTGNGSSQTITNGIDIAGKGGMVWIKSRSNDFNHHISNTEVGISGEMASNDTYENYVDPAGYGITSVSSTGFSVGLDYLGNVNTNGSTFVSWTFRKQPKFFDVVTWTGNGTNFRQIPHSLGVTPKVVLIKCTSNAGNWLWNVVGTNQLLWLNLSNAAQIGNYVNTATATTFMLDFVSDINESGKTYVAYLFADNVGGFGLDGSQSIIRCGSITGNGAIQDLNLGWEPQWLLLKNTSTSDAWHLVDDFRGYTYDLETRQVLPNLANQENAVGWIFKSPTGLRFNTLYSGQSYFYVAIRRGPMKVPTDATKFYIPIAANNLQNTVNTTGFPVDMQIYGNRNGGTSFATVVDRFRGVSTNTTQKANFIVTSNTNAEVITPGNLTSNFWTNTTFRTTALADGANAIWWNFRRAPGFFDVTCYSGTGSARTVSHNLGVAPELMIVKSRDPFGDWNVYHSALGATKYVYLNRTDAEDASSTPWNNTAPTSSVFTVGSRNSVNGSGATLVAYLFASCPGVSKVGSYTGTGATQTISCGFTGGARYVLIKRTDSTGDWWVWDTARGMVSGTDPRLAYNSTAAETNANWVYTTTGGFQIVTSDATVNANGGSYIYLAIA